MPIFSQFIFMKEKIEQLKKKALEQLKKAKTLEEIEAIDTQYLGRKKGELNSILKGIKDLSDEEKRVIGPAANAVREDIQKALDAKRNEIEDAQWQTADQDFDISMPSVSDHDLGSIHPMTKLEEELERIFVSMGFRVLEGPEIESEFFNFSALNIPASHPARDMQDTFWVDDETVLRTHTSPVQVRAMRDFGAPARVVVTGRVYRNEDLDASHEHTFQQLEGFVIDEGISISHLVATLKSMLSGIFQKDDLKVRLRPGYFPFVEPGFELDMRCEVCGGDGCSFCKNTGWVEMLGCGMIHPKVMEAGGIDPKKYSGFAFGMGTTRLVMQKYGIDDIRLLNSGDLRFLKQF